MRRSAPAVLAAIGLTLATTMIRAQAGPPNTTVDDLAKKLQNPVASLISVPIEKGS